MKTFIFSFMGVIALAVSLSMNAQVQESKYAVVKTISMPGEGGWDYLCVDETGGRVFVSHSTTVVVAEISTGKILHIFPNTPGVHGIVLAKDLNKGFISNGKGNSVTVFDLKTLEEITTIPIEGKNPDAIIYDSFSKKVLTFNGKSNNATVIDGVTNAVVATIALEGKPEFPVTDKAGNIYVNIEDKSLISVIDMKTMTVTKSWSIAPGDGPSGLALDNKTHRLFSVCSNKMMVVVDAVSGNVITTLPIGDKCDGVKFDKGLKRAYTSNGDGTLTVVQEGENDTFTVLENFPTKPGSRTLAVDTKSHHIFLPFVEYLPAPADNPKAKKSVKPNSFTLLEIAPK